MKQEIKLLSRRKFLETTAIGLTGLSILPSFALCSNNGSNDPIVLERWKDKLAFVHIGEAKIFHYTQDDFDRWAKSYKDLGLTHICFMSPFHCRMSFHPYWDYIMEAMRKFTISLHEYGLKAVEHFTVTNVHHVGDPLWKFHGVQTVLPYLPGLEALVADENGTINGHRVSSFYQIDGSTGEPFFNPMYKNYTLCVNNPYYREILFKHLEDIYALGVDGIMTDDLENYSINSCACEHCRALFWEKYGYDLPETKDWGTFAGDYTNSQWIDWLKFRHEMNKKFQYDVNDHYESFGMKDMVRPNYVSGCLLSNLAAYPFDAAAPLWTHTFAEFILGIKTGHLTYACENVHRTALAQRNGATSQTLFYPYNDGEIYFSYANAWCWGQAVFGAGKITNSGTFLQYEDDHWSSLFTVRKNSDFAVYFSTDTRDFTQNAETRYQRPMVAWMQAAYLSGLNMDMVFQGDPVEVLLKHKVILASHVAMISKEQLDRLCQYVYRGGTLVAVGDFGVFDETGKERKPNPFIDFDLIIQGNSIAPKRQNLSFNGETMADAYVNVRLAPGSEGAPVIMDNDGNVIAISKTYGKGKIIVMPSSIVGNWYQDGINFLYLPDAGNPPMTDAPPYHVDNLRNSAGTFLKEIIGTPIVDIQIDNPDILGFYHTNWDGTVHSVKLLNIAETFVKEKRRISDKEPIVNFDLNGTKLPYEIELNMPAVDFIPGKAVLSSPEKVGNELEIPVQKIDGRLHFTVPANYFSGFALIELFRSSTGIGKNFSKNSLLQAWVKDSMLHVSGLTPGKTLQVYTTSGTMIYHSIAMSNEDNIKLESPGVYIVHSEDKSIKVLFQ